MKNLVAKLLIFSAFAYCGSAAPGGQTEKQATQGKNLPAGENVLWHDPGYVSSLNFANGSGGAALRPIPPFKFVKEDTGGTTPKVVVKDAGGHTWSVKFGIEVRPSVFSTRLVWACGYDVEVEYFVPHGMITGTHDLTRARKSIHPDGSFTGARFQLRSKTPMYLDSYNWSWSSNPFLGTPQLNGLKVLVMLLSNWDTKDARDRDPTSGLATADTNLGIFEVGSNHHPRYLYFVSDWGASLGHWGVVLGSHSKYDCRAYTKDNADFVKGLNDDGTIRWGFVGKHNEDITQGIRPTDVRWLLQYLGQITDAQLRIALATSGANPEEADCYISSIRARIDQLRHVAR